MKDLLSVLFIILACGAIFACGTWAGRDIGVKEVQATVAKQHLGQYYLNSKTGQVEFQYLNIEAYTQSVIETYVPQKAPRPPQ